MWTRRELACLLAAPVLRAQGVASRNVAPTPRGKPSGLPFHAHFTDIADAAGLRSPVICGNPDRKSYILETVGCGAAFLDYDNDGWLDIFLLSGTRLGGSPEATNRLYHNNRDGNVTDVSKDAGLVQAGTRWGSGCPFIDYDRDGHLDLFVANYLQFDLTAAGKPGSNANCFWKGLPVMCGPRGLPPGLPALYHNNGDGTFKDVSTTSGVLKARGSYMMTAVAADFNNDGWPDIYVACDSTPSFLLRNNHDGTFTDIGLEAGVALNEDGKEQAGMGIGVGDFNLDGQLDLLKTHFADDTSALYRYAGDGAFDDVTVAAGLGVETRFIGWGAGIVDLDNDGNPDLFVATGGVYPEVAARLPDYPMKTPRIVFRNLGNGRFEELTDNLGPGIAAPHCSRGCAFGDFDNDGDLDILIVNLDEPPSLLRNDLTGSAHWLKVKLIGVKSNRGAVGARVTARYGGKTQWQEVLSQASFYSANDSRLHFGLGAATSADLVIRWPNGNSENVEHVEADQLISIREGAGVVKREKLGVNGKG